MGPKHMSYSCYPISYILAPPLPQFQRHLVLPVPRLFRSLWYKLVLCFPQSSQIIFLNVPKLVTTHPPAFQLPNFVAVVSSPTGFTSSCSVSQVSGQTTPMLYVYVFNLQAQPRILPSIPLVFLEQGAGNWYLLYPTVSGKGLQLSLAWFFPLPQYAKSILLIPAKAQFNHCMCITESSPTLTRTISGCSKAERKKKQLKIQTIWVQAPPLCDLHQARVPHL